MKRLPSAAPSGVGVRSHRLSEYRGCLMVFERIQSAASDLQPRLVAWRRDFHRHPELGFEEHRTQQVIMDKLADAGVGEVVAIPPTGVLAIIHGGQAGPQGLLRFDMDALPIQEETGAEYASVIPGRMHACGHDGHLAIGLGVAHVLQAIRDELHGSVRILFQPAEEGLGGAQACIEAGVLESPRPDFALGMHLWNTRPLGWWGITPGAVMAGSDRIVIQLEGKGGHGAAPHLARDVVLAGAYVLTALQSLVSRHVDPLETVVLSMTTFHAGEADNVIPQHAVMEGTLRTMKRSIRESMVSQMEPLVQQQARSFGCKASVTVTPLTLPLVNDPEITASVQRVHGRLFPEAEQCTSERVMASEDMAAYLEHVPGCYIFAGSANSARGLDYSHHHPRFDFDEAVLSPAVTLMASAAAVLLEENP